MATRTRGLIDGLRARDPVALHGAVNQHARRIYRTARGMGFSASEAEDLSQEVFVTFLETIDRFEGRSTISTWLFGILHHKAQERRRSYTRDALADSIDDVFEARFDDRGSWSRSPIQADRLVASHQTAEALRDCLTGLPEQHREVFQLRQVEDLSAAEVGGILGCTINHVGVSFHRTRIRLRACLEGKVGGGPDDDLQRGVDARLDGRVGDRAFRVRLAHAGRLAWFGTEPGRAGVTPNGTSAGLL
ncbi:MAG: RNA polymerase sigma factor [Gemmatimonadetes bacterium]|nr:RNA polymerase sigma factor [Gemmatimonadota bacterium]